MISPYLLAFLASPLPIPPQPTRAIPGRSFGVGVLGTSWASSCWRSMNQSGSPVIAAIRPQRRMKARREMSNVLMGTDGWDGRRGWDDFMGGCLKRGVFGTSRARDHADPLGRKFGSGGQELQSQFAIVTNASRLIPPRKGRGPALRELVAATTDGCRPACRIPTKDSLPIVANRNRRHRVHE